MNKNACKDCTERYVGCHSNCEKYKKFRKKVDYENKKRKEQNIFVDNAYWDYIPKRKRHWNAK